LYRRSYRSDLGHVVYLQSCVRRRLAKKQLKILKAEARSVSKFKEISYKLENKVVELTQNLQKRTEEKKALQTQLEELEKQIQQWSSKHEEADSKAKSLQTALHTAEVELSRREELLQAKADVEKRLEEAIAKAAEKEEAIQRLTNEVLAQAAQLLSQEKAFATSPMRSTEDVSVIATLKSEVGSLREQLNRANAYNALTRGTREPPTSPTFVPALRIPDANGANGLSLASPLHPNRHQRRHSSAGVLQLSPSEYRTSADELMIDVKRSQALNQRAVSVAYNGEDNVLRVRTNGVADLRSYDDLAEEKIRLMQDIKRLDEDVLVGLIRGLKIPAPSTTNPSAVKEILFPANLISLVTNEMWKYGLIPESERFLANVMEAIQAHVMVGFLPCFWTLSDSSIVLQWRGCHCPGHLLAF
jgi:myosin-5